MGWLRFNLWRMKRRLNRLKQNPTDVEFIRFHAFVRQKKEEFNKEILTFEYLKSDTSKVIEGINKIPRSFEKILFMHENTKQLNEKARTNEIKRYEAELKEIEAFLELIKPKLDSLKNARKFLK
ncbi:hypothetical protein COY27_03305 [Candidatus Woesearchaeota archaeon CG_4_10_14_0_2_um_filter_33_13]|nr:MAG: hypothetical protein COY27_03305 [Candidatus Woesearchaeota archaeon CG_4_10_14_0_2_um_filter_33_13]